MWLVSSPFYCLTPCLLPACVPLCAYASMSLSVSINLSVCKSVYLYVCVCMWVCLRVPINVSVGPSVSASVSACVNWSICLSIMWIGRSVRLCLGSCVDTPVSQSASLWFYHCDCISMCLPDSQSVCLSTYLSASQHSVTSFLIFFPEKRFHIPIVTSMAVETYLQIVCTTFCQFF